MGALLHSADTADTSAYHAGIETIAARVIVVSVLGLLACITLMILCVRQSRRDTPRATPHD